MGSESILLLILAVIAAALVVQTILLVVLVARLGKTFRRLQMLVDQVSRGAEPVLNASRDLITITKERITSIAANVDAIAILAKNQMTRLDTLIKDTTDRAQLQVLRLDELVGDTMNRVSETTEAIQKGVLAPVREISAIVAGIRASMEFLFRRSRKTVEHATQDEELFI